MSRPTAAEQKNVRAPALFNLSDFDLLSLVHHARAFLSSLCVLVCNQAASVGSAASCTRFSSWSLRMPRTSSPQGLRFPAPPPGPRPRSAEVLVRAPPCRGLTRSCPPVMPAGRRSAVSGVQGLHHAPPPTDLAVPDGATSRESAETGALQSQLAACRVRSPAPPDCRSCRSRCQGRRYAQPSCDCESCRTGMNVSDRRVCLRNSVSWRLR